MDGNLKVDGCGVSVTDSDGGVNGQEQEIAVDRLTTMSKFI